MSDNYNNIDLFINDPFDVNEFMDNHHTANTAENVNCMNMISDETLFLNEELVPPIPATTASPLFKVSLKCAREKDNCYTNEFPEFLFKKPHKYDLKMIGPIDHNELNINVCVAGESTPIFEDPTRALTTEFCIVDENECIVRFCLLVCSHSLGGKALELVATVKDGVEIFRSNKFKCLARKRARHTMDLSGAPTKSERKTSGDSKNGEAKKVKKFLGKRKRTDSVSSPSDSISSPASPAGDFPVVKRSRVEVVESPISEMSCPVTPPTGSPSNSMGSPATTPNPAPAVTWDLFQLICNLDSTKIGQEGGNPRVHLAINLLNSLNAEERGCVLQYYMGQY